MWISIIFGILCYLLQSIQCSVPPKSNTGKNNQDDGCDQTTIPVMSGFDIEKFSGKWYELAKTTSGYIDVVDGVWKIEESNASYKFLFSGRDNNQHCIRPIKGKIDIASEPPGLLTLKYQTYSTYVEETIRILFTDYNTIAVIYSCMRHVGPCLADDMLGSIWTRAPHVDVDVYEKALKYLELACIHESTLINRNIIGPCKIEDLEFRIDDFPAPDYCYQPRDLGFCRGNLQRFYFEPRENICKTFTYGGCGGNKNNFMSLSECQAKCVEISSKDPVCASVAKCGIHCSKCCEEDSNGCVQCNCERISNDESHDCMTDPQQCPEECKIEDFHPPCIVCKCDPKNNDVSGFPFMQETSAVRESPNSASKTLFAFSTFAFSAILFIMNI